MAAKNKNQGPKTQKKPWKGDIKAFKIDNICDEQG